MTDEMEIQLLFFCDYIHTNWQGRKSKIPEREGPLGEENKSRFRLFSIF